MLNTVLCVIVAVLPTYLSTRTQWRVFVGVVLSWALFKATFVHILWKVESML